MTGEYTTGWFLAAAVGLLAAPLVLMASPPHALAAEYRARAIADGADVTRAGSLPPSLHAE